LIEHTQQQRRIDRNPLLVELTFFTPLLLAALQHAPAPMVFLEPRRLGRLRLEFFKAELGHLAN
jgi:hypothetical protein